MSKTIRIFISSSLRLKEEREKIMRFFQTKDRMYDQKISFVPVICEDFDNAATEAGSQEGYNRALEQSQYVLLFFSNRVGKYTLEEFQRAKKAGCHTYVYQLTGASGSGEADPASVDNFLAELLKPPVYFHERAVNIDDLLNQFYNKIEEKEIVREITATQTKDLKYLGRSMFRLDRENLKRNVSKTFSKSQKTITNLVVKCSNEDLIEFAVQDLKYILHENSEIPNIARILEIDYDISSVNHIALDLKKNTSSFSCLNELIDRFNAGVFISGVQNRPKDFDYLISVINVFTSDLNEVKRTLHYLELYEIALLNQFKLQHKKFYNFWVIHDQRSLLSLFKKNIFTELTAYLSQADYKKRACQAYLELNKNNALFSEGNIRDFNISEEALPDYGYFSEELSDRITDNAVKALYVKLGTLTAQLPLPELIKKSELKKKRMYDEISPFFDHTIT